MRLRCKLMCYRVERAGQGWGSGDRQSATLARAGAAPSWRTRMYVRVQGLRRQSCGLSIQRK